MQADPETSAAAPRVWIINAYRAGEKGQLLALAEALGWPFEVKDLAYRPYALRSNLLRGRTLGGLQPVSAASLKAPWPDLVISAGMRNEPVCRWIREQSGGRTRLVFTGRLWASPEHFDLVITTPQYRVPEHPNVLRNDLPLHRVSAARLAAAREQWAPRLAHLPGPRIAVIMGGSSGPYCFGPKAAERLLRDALALAKSRRGSLLVTSSARTPVAAIDAFEAQREVPAHCYRWRPGDPDNPYFAYLALADELIVSADSISMLAEASSTGKPLHMFDLGNGRFSMRRDAVRGGVAPMDAEPSPGSDLSLPSLAYRALMRWGWKHLSRDISRVHARLLQAGLASWLGESAAQRGATRPDADLTRAVSRVRALFAGQAGA